MTKNKKQPNVLVTKWFLLGVIGVFSIVISLLIYYFNTKGVNAPSVSNVPRQETKKEEPRVMVSLMPNVEKGYVDVYLSNNTDLSAISLVFIAEPGVTLVKLENNKLFADYIYNQKDNQVIIAGTGGANGEIVKAGNRQMFVRAFFDGLKSKDSVALLVDSSEAADTNNKAVSLKLK